MPTFRVQGGKTFAMYAINHHGDGRIALWLSVSSAVQDAHLRQDSKHLFVPPYVGPRGWLGVRLDRGISWKRVIELVRVAHRHVAPARLRDVGQALPDPPPPTRRVTVADIDPRNTPRGRRVLASMRKVCLDLPESSEGMQFGRPVWRAGKRVFAQASCDEGGWRVSFWVGVAAQGLMTHDPRFEIPRYFGHSGWISLDVSRNHSERELRALAVQSYRHFALKRMLARLEADPAKQRTAAR
jgi:predicted DNA-binding protein (MmcQ/YjbR family)